MEWFSHNKDFFSLAIATIAVALSLTTVAMNRRQRKQDTFLRIHELLTSSDIQRGRHLTYDIGRTGVVPVDKEDYATVNRALSTHNTVAMYVRRRVVSRRWVLDSWHHTLVDMKAGAQVFIEYRQTHQHAWSLWGDLQSLIAAAEQHRTNMPCCLAEVKDAQIGVHLPVQQGPQVSEPSSGQPSAEVS
jgi:hypothetical protein